jgi:hypothetical protein
MFHLCGRFGLFIIYEFGERLAGVLFTGEGCIEQPLGLIETELFRPALQRPVARDLVVRDSLRRGNQYGARATTVFRRRRQTADPHRDIRDQQPLQLALSRRQDANHDRLTCE